MTSPETNVTNVGDRFLSILERRLGDADKERIYLCIRDLVQHGLDLTRFAPGEYPPQRQDVTQHLAAWSRHAGLSEEESRGWMLDYCPEVLGPLSKRTAAAIRHSTKSNLKYIYNSAVPFLCGCETNRFRAHCTAECLVHSTMQALLLAKAEEALHPRPYVPPPPPPPRPPRLPRVVRVPLKKSYEDQFKSAMALVREEVAKGTEHRLIVELLTQRGFKTRTGRSWTVAILRGELRASVAPQAAPGVERDAAGEDPGVRESASAPSGAMDAPVTTRSSAVVPEGEAT